MVNIIAFAVTALAVAAIYLFAPAFVGDLSDVIASNDVAEIAARLRGYGIWAFAVSTLVGVALNIIGLPTIAFSGATGLVFGFLPATIICWSAEIIGALFVFVFARKLFYKQALRYIASHEKLASLHEYSAHSGFRALIIARAIPFSPSQLVSIAAALSKVSLRTYLLATAIGKLPAVMGEIYFGRAFFSPWEYKYRLLFFIPLVLVFYFCWRYYQSKKESGQKQY